MSYGNYAEIARDILSTGKYLDYREAAVAGSFITVRHDVEFSPHRAYKLHLVENEIGIQTSYLFQITNNAYNLFSRRNLEYVDEIYRSGHHVGLHYHLSG